MQIKDDVESRSTGAAVSVRQLTLLTRGSNSSLRPARHAETLLVLPQDFLAPRNRCCALRRPGDFPAEEPPLSRTGRAAQMVSALGLELLVLLCSQQQQQHTLIAGVLYKV